MLMLIQLFNIKHMISGHVIIIYPGTECVHDMVDGGGSIADIISTAVYAVSVVSAALIDVAGSYDDTA